MGEPLRALVVEDSKEDYLLLLRELRRAGFEPATTRVDDPEALREALGSASWDIVISDYSMPGFDGLAALRLVRERDLDLPFIIVSGTIGEEVAVAAMRAGAGDYVMKNGLARLSPAVEREIREAAGRRARRQAEEAYRALVESSLQGLLIIQDDGLAFVNPAVAEMLGYSVDELLSLSREQERSILGPAEREAARKRYRERIDDLPLAPRYEVRVTRRDGQVRWWEVSDNRIEFRGRPAVQAAVVDITERLRRAREEKAIATVATSLRVAERRSDLVSLALGQIRALLDADGVALVTLDSASQGTACEHALGIWADFAGTRLSEGDPGGDCVFGTGRPYVGYGMTSSTPSPCPGIPSLTRALAGVPLKAGDTTIGALWIGREASVSDEDMVIFTAVAEMTASAIRRITLHESLERSNLELVEAYDETLEGWARVLELRDSDTEGHTRRVAEMTERLGRALGRSEEELVQLRRGATLHDIGKMAIPDVILRKPGALSDDEWVIMRKHPVYARDMLASIAYLRPALDIPYFHHERWDGKGYPSGLEGESIPMAARIFAVVDVFDALCSDRPYRKAWPRGRALGYLRDHAGRHLDPEIVATFVEVMAEPAPPTHRTGSHEGRRQSDLPLRADPSK